MTTFGFTAREAAFLRRLTPEWRIQKFLDAIDYDVGGTACRSPRRVLRDRTVQCLNGALFAAAALRLQGHRPLVMDLEAVRDDDHVVAVFQRHGRWGAIARSNYSGLRFRESVFRTLRELVLSYFESYFNLRREKTLRRYSAPLDLARFDSTAARLARDRMGAMERVTLKVKGVEAVVFRRDSATGAALSYAALGPHALLAPCPPDVLPLLRRLALHGR